MFATFFKQTTAKAFLVISFLVGTMAVGTFPAAAQVGAPQQLTFTPAQRAAYALATGLSPYEQKLLANAMMKLGPQRANVEFAELAQLNAVAPGFLLLLGPRVITPSLQSIPAQYHQLFMDGLFSVTPTEEQYAKQVLWRLTQALQIQAAPRYMPQPYTPQPYAPQPFSALAPTIGTGNFGSDGDPITQRDVWKWATPLLRQNAQTLMRGLNMQSGPNMDP